MYSICLILLLINNINTINLRCYEDQNGSIQLVERCRTCVIFIDLKIKTPTLHKKIFLHDQSSIQDLFLYDENRHNHQHRHRRDVKTVLLQKCAREYDGPLYGYNQTHCYCNSDLCNSFIQRCMYEITSKRYFSCYHGSNSSKNSLEINKNCRSCRIKKQSNLIYHYECLTFGEQEQITNTHCTCQHPMCNQDFTICQRFQQIPSQPRVNSFFNSTTKIINTTTLTTTATSTTFFITNQTDIYELSTENSTSIELTTVSYNDTNQTQTVIIQIKNHANFMHFSFFYSLYVIISFLSFRQI